MLLPIGEVNLAIAKDLDSNGRAEILLYEGNGIMMRATDEFGFATYKYVTGKLPAVPHSLDAADLGEHLL